MERMLTVMKMVNCEPMDIEAVELIENLYSRRDDRDASMIRALCDQMRKHLLTQINYSEMIRRGFRKAEQ